MNDRKKIEEMYSKYGVEGEALDDLVEKDLRFNERIKEISNKSLYEIREKIRSRKQLEKAEKILKKKRKKK
jgi:hypothetical protein